MLLPGQKGFLFFTEGTYQVIFDPGLATLPQDLCPTLQQLTKVYVQISHKTLNVILK